MQFLFLMFLFEAGPGLGYLGNFMAGKRKMQSKVGSMTVWFYAGLCCKAKLAYCWFFMAGLQGLVLVLLL